MTKRSAAKNKSKHISLIVVEGETEVEFYKLIAGSYLKRSHRKIENLHGNFNIHTKILDTAKRFSDNHPDDTFNLYVCIDQERIGVPAIDEAYLLGELSGIRGFNALNSVIIVLMLESVFFIDIDGIYKFLRAEKNKRNPKKYVQYRKFTHHDLSALFKQFGCIYRKGRRCRGLIDSLDIAKITSTASELAEFIAKYNSK